MRQVRIRHHWVASVVAGASVGLVGCYTVLNHPEISPPDQVTERGDVIGDNQCAGCHTDRDLWSFHHGARWYASGREGYYNYYDRYFLRQPWYGDRYYYTRWLAFYHRPWWYYTAGTGTWTPEAPAIGRGEHRDSVSSVEPRFTPYLDIGPGPMPFTSVGPPVGTVYAGGSGPVAKPDSGTGAAQDAGRPVRVEPRYPAATSPPAAAEPSSGSSSGSSTQQTEQTGQQQKQQAQDEDDQERGRGDDRQGSGSRSR